MTVPYAESSSSAEHTILRSPPIGPYLVVKGAIDRLGALLLLLWSLPVVLVAMVAVVLTSRGSPLYSQKRIGRDGRTFWIYKIRSMKDRCEDKSGPIWSQAKSDDRVTPVGRFLRKTHIDELPQLWNVLIGDMSLIGPRPERPEIAVPMEMAIPQLRDRLAVKPGMTGLAQVQLPPDSDLESVRRKLTCDLYYIRHLGFLMDVRIAFATIYYLAGLPIPAARSLLGVPTLAMAERQIDCRPVAEWSPAEMAERPMDRRSVAEWSPAHPLPA